MRKIIVAIVTIFLISFPASSQLFVGGSINFNTTSGSIKNNGVNHDKASTIDFGIKPKAGYFINDDLAVGASIGLNISRRTVPGNLADSVRKSSVFTIAPFVRYYIMEFGPLSIYGEGEISFGFGREKVKIGSVTYDGPSIFEFGINLTPVVAYKLTNNLDIEASIFSLGYERTSRTLNDEKEIDRRFDFDLSSALNLGFVYKF